MKKFSCQKAKVARRKRIEIRRLKETEDKGSANYSSLRKTSSVSSNSDSIGPISQKRRPEIPTMENSGLEERKEKRQLETMCAADASSVAVIPNSRSVTSLSDGDLEFDAVSPESDCVGSMEGGVVDGGRRAKRRKDLNEVSCISHGSVSVCGRRRQMEDAVTAIPGFFNGESCRFDFFGVYDGHGSSHVADTCKARLHVLLAKELEEYGQLVGAACAEPEWSKVMAACFKKMDAEVNEPFSRGGDSDSNKTVGSTAVVAVVGEANIVVANCGDSRAVLSRAGVAVPLSFDHKPDRPDERERVEAAGGRVIDWDGYRVLGILAASRSIGDRYLKPYVISEPEVTVNNRTESDELLILASDGLWDVMSNEVACEVARKCLIRRATKKFPAVLPSVTNGCRASSAAAVLVELAMARGSKDNISVVVVDLRNSSLFL